MISGMLAEHESGLNITTGTGWRPPQGGRHGVRGPTGATRVGLVLATVGCALTLAACSSATSAVGAAHPAVDRPPVRSSTPTTTTLSPTQRAVVSAWEDAERTLYGYMQEPPAPARAALVAGSTSATLWPDLAEYFANPALKSESLFLVGMTMQELHGPVSYSLGDPVVSAVTATTATVTGCIFDSGTTTLSGKPGPANLDGGGPGGYRGSWDLEFSSGSWRIASFETKSTPRC